MEYSYIDVKWFIYSGFDDIYYEIKFDGSHHISFYHKGNLQSQRELDLIEQSIIFDHLQRINYPQFNRSEVSDSAVSKIEILPSVFTLPVIESKLLISDMYACLEIEWSDWDKDYLNQLEPVFAFTDYISGLLNVDFSELDMPTFM